MKNIGICLTPNKVFSHMFLLEDMESDLKKIAEIGMKAVELSIRDIDDIDAEALAASLTKNKLELITIATGLIRAIDGISLMGSKDDREMVIEKVIRMAGLMAEAGGREKYILIGFIKGELSSSSKEKIDIVKRSLSRIADAGREKGVKILLEIINSGDTNFLNTIKEGMDFLVDLGHDNIKLAIDTYHMSIDEKDICASIKAGRDYIEYIHLSEDNRLSPGMGKIDFKRIMSTLKEIEYRGYLMFECRTAADKYAELSLGYDNIAKISQEVNYNV